VRENGGQYTHAALWTVMAVARLGSGDEAVELFEEEWPDCVLSVSEPLQHPGDMVYFDSNVVVPALPRSEAYKQRQDYPTCYFVDGAIYVLKTSVVGEFERGWGAKVVPYQMHPLESIDIDTPEALILAELIMGYRQQHPHIFERR
jgi:CMP-N-acetylneuraminic acid synthetase